MTLKDVCKKLKIEEYTERIFKSNSHGELFHLKDYFILSKIADENEGFADFFSIYFKEVVKWAEETWERPESVFQHIYEMLQYYYENK